MSSAKRLTVTMLLLLALAVAGLAALGDPCENAKNPTRCQTMLHP